MKLNVVNCVVGCGILQTRVKHNFARLSFEWLRLGVSKQTQGPEMSLPSSVLVEWAHHCKSQFLTKIIIYIFKDFNSPPQILVLYCYKSLWCSLFYGKNPVSGHPTGSTTSTNFNGIRLVFQMNWLQDWRKTTTLAIPLLFGITCLQLRRQKTGFVKLFKTMSGRLNWLILTSARRARTRTVFQWYILDCVTAACLYRLLRTGGGSSLTFWLQRIIVSIRRIGDHSVLISSRFLYFYLCWPFPFFYILWTVVIIEGSIFCLSKFLS